MKKINSYPKVLAIGHRYIQNIFEGTYHVEEKLDGSQISFGIIKGELYMRSKGAEIIIDNPEGMFSRAVESVKDIAHLLSPEWIYRGEYLQKPKHNTLCYDRIPDNHIMIFDIEASPDNHLPYVMKSVEAERIGFECVPLIQFEWSGLDSIKESLLAESCLGGPNMEGIVIKNYDRITLDGKFMAGKFVSEAFKESHSKEWKAEHPSKGDIMQQIVDTLKTEARYHKAIQRLRDNGTLDQSPRDIGNLMKAVHQDIEEEEAEFIKQKLYEYAIKNIKRGVCGGLPEWYKEHLVNGLDIAGGA